MKMADLHAKSGSLRGCSFDRIGEIKMTGHNSKKMIEKTIIKSQSAVQSHS